ncbi:DUF2267 domain-containing protein [Natrinema longum]|uniref:DUF2267 domain-containing protein n=1 Tax=Natrinema longum TaxID=370324 RepID=A0A8A2U7Q7_9EURY|nr:DUF2267 domain-containing protein [Natrinema longum]MBZ6493814.1 DUF2267 domain-containing protein [Natrinema longum]QSW84849.1 DUF2267 domain-containing protein [Natrinema longum]
MSTSDADFIGEGQHRIETGRQAEAVHRIEAVVDPVSERVPGGELAHAEARLPDEFEGLFAFVDLETKPWEAA